METNTKNIKFVAFLRMSKIYPSKVEKLAKGRARYFFELDAEKWEKLKSDFDRSEFLIYAQCLDAVIDLAY